ncbi:MAG: HD domain-containing protein [Lachnospiraceae bacterium]|nr:HD domain-containing protein [Lachnospiraceae bacterium]
MIVIAGIMLNVIIAFISYYIRLPIYLDTIGTVAVTAVGGVFPGIFTAVFTNTICGIFNPAAIYFSFINAIIAILTAGFVKKGIYKKIISLIIFIIMLGVGSGIISALIQWFVLDGPQYLTITDTVKALSERTGLAELVIFIFLNILLNIIDKAIAVIFGFLIMRLIPDRVITSIKNSGWRQNPLTEEEMEEVKERGKLVRHSVRTRIFTILVGISLSMVIVMGWIGISLYYDNAKAEKTEIAQNAVKFAADIIDPGKIDEYLKDGEKVPGYRETEDMLYKIRENAHGVEYMYVVKVEEDGCYFIFDLATQDVAPHKNGDKVAIEKAFEPYLSALLDGEEIAPIESDDISGWVLTVYRPVYNDRGSCVCYVGADISLKYMADYMENFIIKVILIIVGFFILILSYGLWVSGIYLVYPLNTIAECVEGFIKAGDDQKTLDMNVKRIRKLNIYTNDETQILYNSICEMALNMAEQMRGIRHFADSTSKMQNGLIVTMADLVENRDSDTGAHIQKTAAYVKIIVEGLKRKGYYAEKITPKFMSDVVMSAPLHDIGKINIPDAVLNKPGKLTEEEYEIMKTHAKAGKEIMEKAISTVNGENYLKEARNMAAYHHERWDGKGYPEGLHGQVIPLSARIMSVADVFDALASPRVYKPAFPLEKALKIIEEGAGTQFDPKCVEVFMENLDEVKVVLKKYQES